MKDRPKFLLHYTYRPNAQLRVEKIGPDLWCASLYNTRSPLPWSSRTEMTEDAAKRSAMQAAIDRIGSVREGEGDKEWKAMSDMSDEDWGRGLNAVGFPGYPSGHEGMVRWPGFEYLEKSN